MREHRGSVKSVYKNAAIDRVQYSESRGRGPKEFLSMNIRCKQQGVSKVCDDDTTAGNVQQSMQSITRQKDLSSCELVYRFYEEKLLINVTDQQ